MFISFIISYFQMVDKILLWMRIKDYMSGEIPKSNVDKSVTDFVQMFHKLKQELLACYHLRNQEEKLTTFALEEIILEKNFTNTELLNEQIFKNSNK